VKRVALLLLLAVACNRARSLTPEEEAHARLTQFFAQHHNVRKWSPADRATAHRLLRAYTDLPRHDNRIWAGRTYTMLWNFLKRDPKADRNELLLAIRGMEQYASFPVNRFIEPARLLAERNIDLPYAEHLGRRGVIESHRYFQQHRQEDDTPEFIASVVGRAHEALAFVLQKRGRDAEAEQELVAAGRVDPRSDKLLSEIGQFYERRGRNDDAAEWYVRAALVSDDFADAKRAYTARHGSLAGYDALAARVTSDDEGRRKREVLASRIASPKPAPPFRLKTLDGRAASLDDFRGRVAVINFWATWCDWCVKEMPELQRLHAEHANDAAVAIATINVDENDALVKRWMAANHIDVPVIVGTKELATRAGVLGYPTTWFLDRQGRIAFVKLGGTKRLEQEFSWRIAALRP
jgi:thiol-disulfide isomerase/thioredoxin